MENEEAWIEWVARLEAALTDIARYARRNSNALADPRGREVCKTIDDRAREALVRKHSP